MRRTKQLFRSVHKQQSKVEQWWMTIYHYLYPMIVTNKLNTLHINYLNIWGKDSRGHKLTNFSKAFTHNIDVRRLNPILHLVVWPEYFHELYSYALNFTPLMAKIRDQLHRKKYICLIFTNKLYKRKIRWLSLHSKQHAYALNCNELKFVRTPSAGKITDAFLWFSPQGIPPKFCLGWTRTKIKLYREKETCGFLGLDCSRTE